MSNLMENQDEDKPTQDTGLVDAAARAFHEFSQGDGSGLESLVASDRKYCRDVASAIIRAILPHLSPESRATLERELKG